MVEVADLVKLLGGDESIGSAIATFADFVPAIEAGLPGSALNEFLRAGDATSAEMADWLHIPQRTFIRSRKRERLSFDESNKLYRLVYITAAAINALGDRDKATRWLRRKNRALGGAIPVQLIATEPGFREVERILGRIEYGSIS